MIAELWGAPGGRIYYRLDNWHGFYECIPTREQVEDIPDRSICLIRDGQWTGNFIGPGATA